MSLEDFIKSLTHYNVEQDEGIEYELPTPVDIYHTYSTFTETTTEEKEDMKESSKKEEKKVTESTPTNKKEAPSKMIPIEDMNSPSRSTHEVRQFNNTPLEKHMFSPQITGTFSNHGGLP